MDGWWYARNDKKYGPIEAGQIEHMLKSGFIDFDTLLWREGMTTWAPLAEVEEFRSSVNQRAILTTCQR